jgi:hypothetical protein
MPSSNNNFSVFSNNEIKHDILAYQPVMSGIKSKAAGFYNTSVPISAIGAEKSSGFQASGFLKGALANTGFMAGRRANKPLRASTVMMATNGDQEPSVSGGNVGVKQDHMDYFFYSQKYENYKDLPHYTGNRFKDELMKNARKLATPGTGILASDESTGTIGNRFSQIGVENTR